MEEVFLEGTDKVKFNGIFLIRVEKAYGLEGYLIMTDVTISRSSTPKDGDCIYYNNLKQKKHRYQGVRFLQEAAFGSAKKLMFSDMIIEDIFDVYDEFRRVLNNLRARGILVETSNKPIRETDEYAILTPEELEAQDKGMLAAYIKGKSNEKAHWEILIDSDKKSILSPYFLQWDVFHENEILDIQTAFDIFYEREAKKVVADAKVYARDKGYVIAIKNGADTHYLKSYIERESPYPPIIRTVTDKKKAAVFYYENNALETLCKVEIDYTMEIEDGVFQESSEKPLTIKFRKRA